MGNGNGVVTFFVHKLAESSQFLEYGNGVLATTKWGDITDEYYESVVRPKANQKASLHLEHE